MREFREFCADFEKKAADVKEELKKSKTAFGQKYIDDALKKRKGFDAKKELKKAKPAFGKKYIDDALQ